MGVVHAHFAVEADIFGVNRIARGIVLCLASIFVCPAVDTEFGVGSGAAGGTGEPELDRTRPHRTAARDDGFQTRPANRAGENQIGLFIEAAGAVDHLEPPHPRKG